MSADETMPGATKAAILKEVAGFKHPKIELPNLAHRYGLTLAQLQAVLQKHGYPRPESMLRAADTLTAAAQTPQPNVSGYPTVPVADLHPDPDNPREHLGDIIELADSLVEVGMLQPIVARNHEGRLVVVAGHRRLAAAKHLSWTDVPCLVRSPMKPDAVLAAMLIENGHRRDLDPIEIGRALRRLQIEMGDCTHIKLATKIGRSQAFVSERLALLNLSVEEQEAVRESRFKITEAVARGRQNAGTVKSLGKRGYAKAPSHFSQAHNLANRVMQRCRAMKHSTSNSKSVGGVGCGECWEEVVRADERQQFYAQSAKSGQCAICDAPMSATNEAS